MAVELIARVLSQPRDVLDSSEKLVLTVMADRADNDGLLWYAVETIADKASFTTRAVQKIMDRLVARGFVKKLQRNNRSNYYVIQVDRLPLVETKRRTKEAGPAEFVNELDAEPDLFGTGERGSGVTGEPGSGTGERRSPTGEPGSPDSLTDSLIDSLSPSGDGERLEDFIIRRWNELAAQHDKLSPVRFLSDDRKKQIELRTKDWAGSRGGGLTSGDESGWTDTPEWAVWRSVFATIGSSKLLTGQKTSWAATLNWVLGKQNFAKIMEGNYGHGHDCIGAPSRDPNDRSAVSAGRAARELVERGRNRRRPAAEGARGYSGGASGARR